MQAFLKLTWTETKLFFREPIAAFFTLVFPLMLLFLFGGIYGNEPSKYFNGYGSVDVSVPNYTGMIIGTSGLMSLAITLANYRERGILRRLRATPLQPLALLAAELTVLFGMTLAGMLTLVVAGKLVYHLRFGGNVLSVLGGFTLGCLSFFALGMVLAGLVPNPRTAQIVGMAALYPMMFMSGATLPIEFLPASIRAIAQFLPLTYVVALLRGLWLGDPWSQHLKEVAILAGIMVVATLVAAKVFRWE